MFKDHGKYISRIGRSYRLSKPYLKPYEYLHLSLKHLFNVKICKKLSKTVKEPNEPNSGGTDSESLFSYPFCLISFYNSHASLNVSYEFAEEMILR